MWTTIIKKTLRVPRLIDSFGDSTVVAQQLDVALISIGFKLSRELLEHIARLDSQAALKLSVDILAASRELTGSHVEHNTYFIDFPRNVPDTVEFWHKCIVDGLGNPASRTKVIDGLLKGIVNLLDLPLYGKYLHTFDEMLAAHEQFIPAVTDRMTILHLGKTLSEEALELYLSLAGSAVPLNEADRGLLAQLALFCVNERQPERFTVRENKAIINRVRMEHGMELLADTVTDVLRLACFVSDGDPTLVEMCKFRSFSKASRRALLAALERIIRQSPAKLADVNQYCERWKRLGERLHPHEYPQYPHAQQVFATARGERQVRSLASRVETAFAGGRVLEAVSILTASPGLLLRNLDRILRYAPPEDLAEVAAAVNSVAGAVSGRVLLSVIEHLKNRHDTKTGRIFINRQGKGWVAPDERGPVTQAATEDLVQVLETELASRLPETPCLFAAPEVAGIALPLSTKNHPDGFRILPRGSTMPVGNGILRFFIHWRQASIRTDYDLSLLILDENFISTQHVSWTNLRTSDGIHVHSGDLTEAPQGASEFIDINLELSTAQHLIPQVNFYSGEDYCTAAECFFGYMTLDPQQRGAPFEPRAVRVKSELRGNGRVCLPVVFSRDSSGGWSAKWLQLMMRGEPKYNRIEANRLTTTLLTRVMVERKYLTVGYLVELMRRRAASFSWYTAGVTQMPVMSVTFIGEDAPEGLPPCSTAYTLSNLHQLIGLTG